MCRQHQESMEFVERAFSIGRKLETEHDISLVNLVQVGSCAEQVDLGQRLR